MNLHRLLVLSPLVAGLLVPAVAFAGGEVEAGGAAAAMERTTFDHAWNDIRYYNHIGDYTAATGNTIDSFNEAPILAARWPPASCRRSRSASPATRSWSCRIMRSASTAAAPMRSP